MNMERTQAYGRVVRTLDDLGPVKLHADEQQRVREAADTLIFATSFEETRPALEDIEALVANLVESGRWSEERAERLLADIQGCGVSRSGHGEPRPTRDVTLPV
jgi:hypothetical protein